MGMKHWWNGTDRGKLKCWKKNLSDFHFFLHESDLEFIPFSYLQATAQFFASQQTRLPVITQLGLLICKLGLITENSNLLQNMFVYLYVCTYLCMCFALFALFITPTPPNNITVSCLTADTVPYGMEFCT